MSNDIINYNKNQAFWLNFSVQGLGVEWQDYDLPTPHYLHHHPNDTRYAVAWAIVGFFGTTASKEFLLDVVARFCLALEAQRLPWKPEERDSGHFHKREPYELKQIAECLPSLPWSHEDAKLADFVEQGIEELNRAREKADKPIMTSEDALFEATRWHLYRRAYAEGTVDNITEDYVQILLETENQLLTKPRSAGTVRAKAKRMAEYMQDEFIIFKNDQYKDWSKERKVKYMRNYRKRKGLTVASRTEHMRKVNKNKKLKSRAKIEAVLNDLFKREEIRMKNGKLKIGAIAKFADLDRDTVSDHLKEMGLI